MYHWVNAMRSHCSPHSPPSLFFLLAPGLEHACMSISENWYQISVTTQMRIINSKDMLVLSEQYFEIKCLVFRIKETIYSWKHNWNSNACNENWRDFKNYMMHERESSNNYHLAVNPTACSKQFSRAHASFLTSLPTIFNNLASFPALAPLYPFQAIKKNTSTNKK